MDPKKLYFELLLQPANMILYILNEFIANIISNERISSLKYSCELKYKKFQTNKERTKANNGDIKNKKTLT